MNSRGRLYSSNLEQNASFRRRPTGEFETVVRAPRLIRPDTLDSHVGDRFPFPPSRSEHERDPQTDS